LAGKPDSSDQPERQPQALTEKASILDRDQMRRVIRRMAGEIIELNRGVDKLLLVGIRTRGVPLAKALAAEMQGMEGTEVPIGTLDITLYRDDLSTIAPQPVVKGTHFPVALSGWTIVLCDDVLYTGRTVRAALDHLVDYGRPRAVQLAVLVDRGHRELPIQADVVGETVPTRANEVIEVAFEETDGESRVRIMELREPPGSG
jgi:pyrimidine operon attenuation protein / uracil phosphoribosyltransferase